MFYGGGFFYIYDFLSLGGLVLLFHVTSVHTPETCPANDPARIRDTFGKMLNSADDIGVKVHSVYSNSISHTFYMVVETDEMSKISAMFEPTLKIATADIVPIQDAHQVMAQFSHDEAQ